MEMVLDWDSKICVTPRRIWMTDRMRRYSGFYVSKTSLEDQTFPVEDPRRYVDATRIPYVVLNPFLRKQAGVDLGDLAVVVLNSADHRVSFGIVADIGPRSGLGECLKALADSIEKPNGVEGIEIVYIFFTSRDARRIRTRDEINKKTMKLFEAWGGIARVLSH